MNGMKKNIGNFIKVALSNAMTIVSGVFVGFLIPKILSVPDYGLYKTFTLYIAYVGFFSLGIIDGIVLKYGDKDYKDIDQEKFRSFFEWYFIIHIIFGVLISFFGCVIFEQNARFIIITLAINMIAVNLVGYFQQISQITQKFGEYSAIKIMQSIFNIVAVGILYIIFLYGHEISYKACILIIVVINIVLTFWYLKIYKDIIFGKKRSLKSTRTELMELIKEGFPLLVANLCSSLILSIDKQFVNVLFSTNEYAIYAFSYNMLSLVTLATSAFATVLYPLLKRTKVEKLKETYEMLISMLLIIVYCALLVYFPLCYIVRGFLPKYIESLSIFRIIFPGLAISSCVTIVMHNYYKTLGKNLVFFKKSTVILILTCVTNAVAYLKFRNTQAISGASIVTIVIWYLYIENDFVKEYQFNRWNNIIFAIICMLGFYACSNIQNIIVGMLCYAIFLLMTIILFKRRILFAFVKQYLMSSKD